jgi:hypothetical protein
VRVDVGDGVEPDFGEGVVDGVDPVGDDDVILGIAPALLPTSAPLGDSLAIVVGMPPLLPATGGFAPLTVGTEPVLDLGTVATTARGCGRAEIVGVERSGSGVRVDSFTSFASWSSWTSGVF